MNIQETGPVPLVETEKLHWAVVIQVSCLYLTLILVTGWIYGLRWNTTGVIFLVWLLAVAYHLLEAHFSSITVTIAEVRVKKGLLWIRRIHIPMHKIATVQVDQSPLGRLLNYGNLTICTEDGRELVFGPVNSPELMKSAVNNRINTVRK